VLETAAYVLGFLAIMGIGYFLIRAALNTKDDEKDKGNKH